DGEQAGAGGDRLAEFQEVHYHAMAGLLRHLARMRPFSAEDYALARRNFGPRLVIAMKVVESKIHGHHPDIATLPEDQQADIRRFLGGRRQLHEGEEAFSGLWDAFPQNYQPDPAQNQSSPDLLDEHGLSQAFENTCAIRLSVMLNSL